MPFLRHITLQVPTTPETSHPFDLPAVAALRHGLELHPRVTFFVGENGAGKSTILEALADKWGFSMKSGNRVSHPGMRAYETALAPHLTLSRKPGLRPMDGFFLRAESFYNFATEMDELEQDPWTANGYRNYGGRSLHEQSHGESFMATFLNRLDGHGLFLLDEPEAALSPTRQLAFVVRMHDLARDFSQFIIATHSPLILAYPDAYLYRFDDNGIERVELRETDHYRMTKRFLDDPEGMMARLLADDEPDEPTP